MGYIATNLVPILSATVAGLLIGLLYAAATGRAVVGRGDHAPDMLQKCQQEPRHPTEADLEICLMVLDCI